MKLSDQIKNRWTGAVMCGGLTLEVVIEKHRKWLYREEGGERADLRGSNLRGSDLSGSNLRGSDLSGSNLSDSNLSDSDLRGSNLSGSNLSDSNLSDSNLSGSNLSDSNLRGSDLSDSNLSDSNLRGSDLRGSNLSGSNLSDSNLSGSNLSGSNLSHIKKDFFERLALAKEEVVALYDFIIRGKINGSVYQGECACFCGTIANIRKENYSCMTIDLRPDSGSPTEIWFYGIRKGDIPENSQIVAITASWLREFMEKEGLKYPSYKLVSSAEFPAAFQEAA